MWMPAQELAMSLNRCDHAGHHILAPEQPLYIRLEAQEESLLASIVTLCILPARLATKKDAVSAQGISAGEDGLF